MTGVARMMRTAIALAGLMVAAGGAVATVLAPGQDADRVSAGATDPAIAWLLLAGAATLVAAGVIAWVARPESGLVARRVLGGGCVARPRAGGQRQRHARGAQPGRAAGRPWRSRC